MCPIRAKPDHFRGLAILQAMRDRPRDHRNAHEPALRGYADSEQIALRTPMMAMVRREKGERCISKDRYEREAH